MNSSLRKICIIIAAIVFVTLGIMARGISHGILFDQIILNWVATNKYQGLFLFMKGISFAGSELFLFPVMGVVILYTLSKKKYYISTLLLLSSLGSWLLNHLLKQIFGRIRPLDYFLVDQGGLSYPSGHSMVTMSMFLTIAYLLSRNKRKKTNNSGIYIIVGVYIVLMGLSRLFLGVHWPTDIIGGFAAGYLFFELYINLINPDL